MPPRGWPAWAGQQAMSSARSRAGGSIMPRAATDRVPALDATGTSLGRASAASRAALIHNDFKLDNVVLAADDLAQVVAVLDWEMATIGDPLMDLGVTLAYWIEEGDPPVLQRVGLGLLPGSLRRAEVVVRYAERPRPGCRRPRRTLCLFTTPSACSRWP